MSSNTKSTSIVKILVIGDVATGKTSIIHRYCHRQFDPAHRPTLGVEFALKKLKVNDQKYSVQLWDIAGKKVTSIQVKMR